MTFVKPVVKWVGGKRNQVNDLLSGFPREMNNYHEPFLGGASVLFALLHKIKEGNIRVSNTVYAYDTNETLIHMYINIQKQPEEVFLETHRLAKQFYDIPETDKNRTTTKVNRKPTSEHESLSSRESFYYWIRAKFNENPANKTSILSSAYFIFLNKLCFRGLFRVACNGFNVPFGNYRNPEIINRNNILAVSALIQKVVFRCLDFRQLENQAIVQPGDFVYLDPPYAPVNPTSFVKYAVNGFTTDDHLALFQQLHDFNQRGVQFIMSNSDAPLVIDNVQHVYNVRTVSCRRAINAKKPGSVANEVIVTNVF